jgi:hypothetical protein
MHRAGRRSTGHFPRSPTDTFAGIHPAGVPEFVLAQLSGALVATVFSAWLFELPPRSTSSAEQPVDDFIDRVMSNPMMSNPILNANPAVDEAHHTEF